MNNQKKRFASLMEELNAPSEDGELHASRLLQRAAQLWPNRTALVCDGDFITYHELYDRACRVTTYLQSNYSIENTPLCILYENSIMFYALYFGAWQANAIVAPLNVYLHEKELEYIIADAQPTCIIASEKQHKKLEKCATSLPPVITPSEIDKAMTVTPAAISPQPPQTKHECTLLLYTSGTTGHPKGVMLSSHAIITNACQGIAHFQVNDHERVFAAMPLFHSYMQNAAVWAPFIVGATVIIVPHITRSYLQDALKEEPTVIVGIPQLYGLFCMLKTCTFDNVRLFLSGGDALHSTVCMHFELLYQRKIANGYGLTEAAPFISVDISDARPPVGCIGMPLTGIIPRICEGELWICGNNLMLGYYQDTQATGNALDHGWLKTGDLAYFCHKGIVLSGRKKHLIIHKGFNIYPQEIENVLTQHPNVRGAAVVPRQQDHDEIPVAYVEYMQDDEPDTSNLAQELETLCRDHIARYKLPHAFYIRKELPRTATGKIDKKSLQKDEAEHEEG